MKDEKLTKLIVFYKNKHERLTDSINNLNNTIRTTKYDSSTDDSEIIKYIKDLEFSKNLIVSFIIDLESLIN